MFVQRLPYIIYRSLGGYGYLTDNRNFGYDTATKSCRKVGDLLLSKEGNVFYALLTNHPQSLDEIVCKLNNLFTDVEYSKLYADAALFYGELQNKGFVRCSSTESGVNIDDYFSYNNDKPYQLNLKNEFLNSYEKAFNQQNYLYRVHIDIASRCNEQCVHCYIPVKNKINLMSEAMLEHVLHQCVSMGVLNITISGGEPMLSPYLLPFLLKCSEANFSINLLSNLVLLSDDLVEVIAKNPLISVQTSLYAMDETIHDKITCHKGSYRKTINAIKLLHRRNVPLQINCPIMKQNVHCYKDVLDFAATMNIEASADSMLYGCYDLSKSNLGCRLTLEDIKKVIETDCRDKKRLQEILSSAESKRTGDTDPICPICKSSLCVSNGGDVYPCEGLQRFILGNLSKQSLAEIWSSPKVKQLRNLTFGDFPKCGSCLNKKFCTTCLVMNANEDAIGDYMNVNPFVCSVAEMKKECVQRVLNE